VGILLGDGEHIVVAPGAARRNSTATGIELLLLLLGNVWLLGHILLGLLLLLLGHHAPSASHSHSAAHSHSNAHSLLGHYHLLLVHHLLLLHLVLRRHAGH